MSYPNKIDHTQRGLDRLLTQFTDKPNLEAFLSTYLDYLNEVETCYEQLLTERSLPTAIGVQLDIIGALIGEQRLGRGDVDYREALYSRVFINNSEGTPEDVMTSLKLITGATKVQLWEHYPASVHLLTNGETIPNNLQAIMQKIVPAACGVVRVMIEEDPDSFLPCEIDPISSVPVGDFTRAILYEVFTITFSTSAGEPVMECGEPLAECSEGAGSGGEVYDRPLVEII